MAARRLLIVMLVLLGLSTLAAALVPQHSLRRPTVSGQTTTTQPQTTTTTAPPLGRHLYESMTVGGKQPPPVLGGPICKGKPHCLPPARVGDQLSLSVFTEKGQAELEIPHFGLVGVATQTTPAMFEILFDQPGRFGLVYTGTDKVAATIEVLTKKKAKAAAKAANARRRARGGSGRP